MIPEKRRGDSLILEGDIKEVTFSTYLQDPITKELDLILKKEILDFADIYRIKKYLLNKELKPETRLEDRQISWICNNLKLIHKIVNNDNGRRLFLSFRYPRNIRQLARKLKLNRATIRHWIDKLLSVELIVPHEFSEGMEKLYRRHIDNRKNEIVLLDYFCENKHKIQARKKIEKQIENLDF